MTTRLTSFVLLSLAIATSSPQGMTPAAAASQPLPGRVLWTFQTDGPATTQFVTRAPDGTIYTSDIVSFYALSPAGELLWSNRDGRGGRPISLGADGTIHTARGSAQSGDAVVVAIAPDGTTLWQFDVESIAQGGQGGLLSGPNVGPDGMIYAVQEALDFGGLGAFALDPQGELVWSNQGEPPIHSDPGDNAAITFGDDRLHAGIVTDGSSAPVLYTFDLDGEQLWTTWPYAPVAGASHPVMDPQNRVIGAWGQTGMRAFSPDGDQEWVAIHPDGSSFLLRPAVDSMGNVYTADFIGLDLWSIHPDGSTRWVQPSTGDLASHVAVSPDDAVLIVDGTTGFGSPFWIRGYASLDGSLLWQVDLAPENGLNQFVTSTEPAFTPSGSTAYFTTQFVGGSNDYGYVIAIALDEPTPGDLDGDGVVDGADLAQLLAAWGSCDAPQKCPADLDGDGLVGSADLGVLFAAWTSGVSR